ncbi:MAG: hypothetical protein RLZZ303_917 [Candidatus Hydrogenedentota bacterium]
MLENPFALRALSAFGLVAMLAMAWMLSEDRRAPNRRIILWGMGLQILLGILILLTPFGVPFFAGVRAGFDAITDASREGAKFLFGNLTDFFMVGTAQVPGANGLETIEGFPIAAVVGFRVLPTIIFVAGLASVLAYLGITQRIIGAIAWLMRRTLRTSGAETFSAALLVFMGIEGISALGAYLQKLTRSELFAIMTAHLSTIAASVMVAYASFGADPGHLMAASLMSAPAALLIAKLMVPEQELPATGGVDFKALPSDAHNVFDAAYQGASLGLKMALNVAAMLIVFIGLIHLLDLITTGVTSFFVEGGVSLSVMLGWLFRPFAFLMGVPWQDIPEVARLLAIKTFFNEFIAYENLQPLIANGTLQPRSVTIATYALCGFANPGSLGIMIGALDALAPHHRDNVARLAVRALIAGTLASFTTACVAGMLVAS